MKLTETIAAISTANASGAIAIVRMSGCEAVNIALKTVVIKLPEPEGKPEHGMMYRAEVRESGSLIDDCFVVFFLNPKSYTGEDIVEVHCHGSQYIQNKILSLFLDLGARMADPGEFTLRAFLNGKMDLSQAEAVGDLIASKNQSSHRLALNQLRGSTRTRMDDLRQEMLGLTSLIELELDFSGEDVEFASRKKLFEISEEILHQTAVLAKSFESGNAIRTGIPVVIAGKPNTGKSTLLNSLTGDEKALVSEIPGTTRDVIEEILNLEGLSFRFSDTAGLRQSNDPIEKMGIERTQRMLSRARIVLMVSHITDSLKDIRKEYEGIAGNLRKDQSIFLLINKTDLLDEADKHANFGNEAWDFLRSGDRIFFISARFGHNLKEVESAIVSHMKERLGHDEDIISVNARHYESLKHTEEAIRRVRMGLQTGLSGDLLAQDLRDALYHLGLITGEVTTDEVLGEIFGKFCIGK